MLLFGDLDILSFVRISHLNLIGQVYRINGKRKVIHLLNNNHKGTRETKGQKNGGCLLTDIER